MKLQKYIAELLGAFTLTLAVALSLISPGAVPTPVIAALVVGLFVYTVGAISGAHFNPAVTIALATVKKISWSDALIYILMQLVGAELAMTLPQWLTGNAISLSPNNDLMTGAAEALGAFFLVFGISAVIHENTEKGTSGLVIGGSLLLGILIASGASHGILNPAVAVGLGSISVAYMLGPIVGGLLAAWVYKYLASKQK